MHIVYSAFTENADQIFNPATLSHAAGNDELMLRLLAHQEVCAKYSKEIMAIRKYLPDWKPGFGCELLGY